MTNAPTDRPVRPLWPLLLACAASAGAASAQVGTSYCTPAPNSTGAPASISGSGSPSVPANDLVLSGTNLPQHAAAYFLCSRTQDVVLNPGGSAGTLCLGNPIGRRVGGVITNSGAVGVVSVAADLNAMPQPNGPVVVLPGETWNFQCWYRDASAGGGATSNFSDGLEVLFAGSSGPPIPALVSIPAGTFPMGSDAPLGLPYFGPVAPVHQVTISYPFWMGRFELTQAEYQALMGANPSAHVGASRPVEQVSWIQARAYCAALTAQLVGSLPAGYECRLPTEAEWEYACRAGTTTEFHTGPDLLCHQARFLHSYHSNPPAPCGNPPGSVPVGGYAPNAFGLYDMHGNVFEWCLDSYAPYSPAPVTDPFVTGGPYRVYRGGSWYHYSIYCRSAFRGSDPPVMTYALVGFRVVVAPALAP